MLNSFAQSANEYERSESQVRSYCRAFPVELSRGSGSHLYSKTGLAYLDFLMGCGSLNYGHNPQHIRNALIDYIACDGLALGLDLHSEAKGDFLKTFRELILEPRDFDYRIHFTGPTGTNAVEAAIKLARKVTGRHNIIAFTNAFHGCSLGSLALTANSHHRGSSSALLQGVQRASFDGYFGSDVDTADLLERQLTDLSGGFDKPAAIIFETVQGEGGLNVASAAWAQKIAALAKKVGALLIVDDIQAGCGRTGSFFSFEPLGIKPDIITLAKSISGFGLPMALTLIAPAHDGWEPGEHNGTFRGNNHAFITAAAALKEFWADEAFAVSVRDKARLLQKRLTEIARNGNAKVKGRGLMLGLSMSDETTADKIKRYCFAHNLILETCGPNDDVVKLLPALTVTEDEIEHATHILSDAVAAQH
ncbi:diaminobutyrate--2-oxoglutarate transaminase [Rhizobium leguminosarum bv. trifolii]|uniref:diaminobutyrate--2-oxoglutarate transaminase n=1 Tax=Rhizobium leguminosarum TaxID=384 RepID=UPI000E2F5BC8|nr:diaminobutyrate--2-oxoglutarate transaminase [Rhizobium leguminosarum]RFB88826.1 diaminobutyrate--2-oxoglutarate transaminase [Rhizobium leguminosarum bv. trifolii]